MYAETESNNSGEFGSITMDKLEKLDENLEKCNENFDLVNYLNNDSTNGIGMDIENKHVSPPEFVRDMIKISPLEWLGELGFHNLDFCPTEDESGIDNMETNFQNLLTEPNFALNQMDVDFGMRENKPDYDINSYYLLESTLNAMADCLPQIEEQEQFCEFQDSKRMDSQKLEPEPNDSILGEMVDLVAQHNIPVFVSQCIMDPMIGCPQIMMEQFMEFKDGKHMDSIEFEPEQNDSVRSQMVDFALQENKLDNDSKFTLQHEAQDKSPMLNCQMPIMKEQIFECQDNKQMDSERLESQQSIFPSTSLSPNFMDWIDEVLPDTKPAVPPSQSDDTPLQEISATTSKEPALSTNDALSWKDEDDYNYEEELVAPNDILNPRNLWQFVDLKEYPNHDHCYTPNLLTVIKIEPKEEKPQSPQSETAIVSDKEELKIKIRLTPRDVNVEPRKKRGRPRRIKPAKPLTQIKAATKRAASSAANSRTKKARIQHTALAKAGPSASRSRPNSKQMTNDKREQHNRAERERRNDLRKHLLELEDKIPQFVLENAQAAISFVKRSMREDIENNLSVQVMNRLEYMQKNGISGKDSVKHKKGSRFPKVVILQSVIFFNKLLELEYQANEAKIAHYVNSLRMSNQDHMTVEKKLKVQNAFPSSKPRPSERKKSERVR